MFLIFLYIFVLKVRLCFVLRREPLLQNNVVCSLVRGDYVQTGQSVCYTKCSVGPSVQVHTKHSTTISSKTKLDIGSFLALIPKSNLSYTISLIFAQVYTLKSNQTTKLVSPARRTKQGCSVGVSLS